MKWIDIEDRLPKKNTTVLTCGDIYSNILKTDDVIVKNSKTTGVRDKCGKWILDGDKHPVWGNPFYYTEVKYWLEIEDPCKNS